MNNNPIYNMFYLFIVPSYKKLISLFKKNNENIDTITHQQSVVYFNYFVYNMYINYKTTAKNFYSFFNINIIMDIIVSKINPNVCE